MDMPPFDLQEQVNIDDHGSTITGVRALPRNVVLPLLVHLDTFGAWRAKHKALVRAFDPTLGDGRLELTQPDGETRVLYARYSQGMEGKDVADPTGLWHRIYPLQLRAVDPWWYAPEPVVYPFGVTKSGGGFLTPPFLPLKLSGSGVLGETTADNDGDVLTYPVWRINGPAGLTTLSNRTTGRSLTFNLDLSEGQYVTVDMRPRRTSIYSNDGVNLFPLRVGTPDFWPLLRGTNEITLNVAGADPTTTSVAFTYTPRYLMA